MPEKNKFMRIPLKYKFKLLQVGRKKIVLDFKKRFHSTTHLISLGCNCHPSHLLAAMELRKESFPFDWLLTDPIKGLNYSTQNLEKEFAYYTSDLKLQADGKAYAGKFPESCFFHHSELIYDFDLRKKIENRAARFIQFQKNNNCHYLYALPAASVNSDRVIKEFLASVQRWRIHAKQADCLGIYLTCTEGIEENFEYCNALMAACNSIKGVSTARFSLFISKYGLWGYENDYYKLLKDLQVPVKFQLPSIKLMLTE